MIKSAFSFLAAVHRLAPALARFVPPLPPFAQSASRASADGVDASITPDEEGAP
jgi:hypothetical protein